LKNSLLVLTLIISFRIHSQDLKLVDSLVFQSEITCACANYKNEIFIGLASGEIVVTDPNGKINKRFSHPNTGPASHIDCANPLKVLVFFENAQTYLFMDRFAADPSYYQIDNDAALRVDFLTLAADQSIWMATSPDLWLTRKDLVHTSKLYQLTNLLQDDETLMGLFSLRNAVVLQTNRQFFYFNLAGQLIQSIPSQRWVNPMVNPSAIYFVEANKLVSTSLDGLSFLEIKAVSTYSRGLTLSDNKLILMTTNRVDYFIR
jgi:hypothetical protein